MAPLFQQPFMSGGFPSMNRAGGAVGGWVELGRTTLGSAGTNIDVSSIPDKRYYMILSNTYAGGSPDIRLRLGNSTIDTGSNYASRWSENGSSDSTQTSASNLIYDSVGNIFTDKFNVGYIANVSSKEKLILNHSVDGDAGGASVASKRSEFAGKWTNTSNPLDILRVYGTSNLSTGSELVVLGWDPADTHTNNFWEELASVTADGTSTDMSSGTITAKKYLWIQLYQKGRAGDVRLRFNSDSGSNYTRRYSQNGGVEGTDTSVAHISNMIGYGSTPSFGNAFIINNQSNEKLIMGHHILQNTGGAGTIQDRMEFVGKWANTSNQITNVNILSSSGNFPSGSILKVWGAD